MKRYDADDIITMYFVISDKYDDNRVKAWSDEKEYCKVYMEFHNCKSYHMKSMNGRVDDLCKIIEENNFEELGIYNLTTKDSKGNKKFINVPLTITEYNFINSECNDWFISRIDYNLLYSAVDFLKDKYRKGLKRIALYDVMEKVLSKRQNQFTSSVELDELRILLRSFPSEFGR